jgi:hypothetical protein
MKLCEACEEFESVFATFRGGVDQSRGRKALPECSAQRCLYHVARSVQRLPNNLAFHGERSLVSFSCSAGGSSRFRQFDHGLESVGTQRRMCTRLKYTECV